MNGSSQKRVLVGLSGGVDSTAAAILLREAGYEVCGLTLKLWDTSSGPGDSSLPCGNHAAAQAREVCQRLGIPFFTVDGRTLFRKTIIEYFASEYRAGRTPNPCVRCNEQVKFTLLMKQADELGIPWVATGHYARVERCAGTGRHLLKRGKDSQKDQSYFLCRLHQNQLARILLPLGEKSKREVRALVQRHQLPNKDRPESMEVCFVTGDSYGHFLLEQQLATKRRGDIVDTQGRKVGEHEGIEFFTIGQRRGLRVASTAPLYVVALDAATNRVIVGHADRLEQTEMIVEQCNWMPFDIPTEPFAATARIRYRHPGANAMVLPLSAGSVQVKFAAPQRAVTPGQACVFYHGDLVLGGGWIRS